MPFTLESRSAGNVTAILRCPTSAQKDKLKFTETALSPDAKILAAAASDTSVSVWDLHTRQELTRIPMSGAPLTVSANGRWCVAARYVPYRFGRPQVTAKLHFRDLHAPDREISIPDPPVPPRLAAISTDGERIAIASREKAWIVDPRIGEVAELAAPKNTTITAIAVAPDGSRVAIGYSAGTLTVWSANGSRTEAEPKVSAQSIHQLCFSPDGTSLIALDSASVSGSGSNWYILRSPAWTSQGGLSLSAAFGWTGIGFPDDQHFCFASDDHLRVVDLANGQIRRSAMLPTSVPRRESAAWAQRASCVAFPSTDGNEVQVLDLNSGWLTRAPPPFATYEHQALPVRDVVFSASGKFVTAGEVTTLDKVGYQQPASIALANWGIPAAGKHAPSRSKPLLSPGGWSFPMRLFQGPGADDVSIELNHHQKGDAIRPKGLLVWHLDRAKPEFFNGQKSGVSRPGTANPVVGLAANCNAGAFSMQITTSDDASLLHQFYPGAVSKSLPATTVPGQHSFFSLSPDGTQAAISVEKQVMLVDLRSSTVSPLPNAETGFTCWSPDSSRLYIFNGSNLAAYEVSSRKFLAGIKLPTGISALAESDLHATLFVAGTEREAFRIERADFSNEHASALFCGVVVALRPVDLSCVAVFETHHVTPTLAPFISKATVPPMNSTYYSITRYMEQSMNANIGGGMTNSLAISPDGTLLASGGITGEAKIWKIESLLNATPHSSAGRAGNPPNTSGGAGID